LGYSTEITNLEIASFKYWYGAEAARLRPAPKNRGTRG
jgi:hypothetical protein